MRAARCVVCPTAVVHAEIAADRPHHHLTSVQADADVSRDSLGALDLYGIGFHGLLHAQRRVARPDGMVFMRDRGPKQRHDPVAHDLVHRPLVAVHGRHHAFEHRVEEVAGLLGVAVGQQLHRPLQVGEQHRHLLALAFEGHLRGQDLLDQMARRIAEGGLRSRGWRLFRERSGALPAKGKSRRIVKAAVRTAPAE
jgi:hypothetical protein